MCERRVEEVGYDGPLSSLSERAVAIAYITPTWEGEESQDGLILNGCQAICMYTVCMYVCMYVCIQERIRMGGLNKSV